MLIFFIGDAWSQLQIRGGDTDRDLVFACLAPAWWYNYRRRSETFTLVGWVFVGLADKNSGVILLKVQSCKF